ncbi:MAG: hypothetical protein QOJ65_2252 [Fimbriimonadaceae bacterium]|nr:hypothetical protein [Fimbriimonadaceae bacterium]
MAGKGLFPEEYAVTYNLSSGLSDSLYVDFEDVKFDGPTPNGKPVEALLIVYPLQKLDERAWLVDLPRDGFVHGSRIRVPAEDLQPA